MGYSAKILKDSISEEGHRLTTFDMPLYRCAWRLETNSGW
jgi:hypothetical protein